MSRTFLLALLLPFSLGRAGATSGVEYRKLADAAVAKRQYAQAADYYRREAAVYRARGDVNGAKVEEMKADRWATSLRLFADLPADPHTLEFLTTHAKYEPLYGCYLGAYVAVDDRLSGGGELGNAQYANKAAALAEMLHKPLATSWDYCSYGAPFPVGWAQALLEKGIAPHVAWEPNRGLDRVQDDDYLQQFARDAASCKGPVFLRFAGEMNGDWTAWHKDPGLYRTKFRLVHDVMARLAPNVAMIWCVNQMPEYNIDDYYPGDAYVDWVGINFYSVLHHDNDPGRPAGFENPATLLKYVYSRYAARKPIAICEYGASHREKLNPGVDKSEVAATKIAELFSALPRLYPRVKLVGIYDCDNLTAEHIQPGRQLNDYSITDSPTVLAAVTRAVDHSYYLPRVVQGAQRGLPPYVAPVDPEERLPVGVELSAWVQSYDERPTVRYSVDGKEIARISGPGEYRTPLDPASFPPGPHRIEVEALDSSGGTAGSLEVPVVLQSVEGRPAPKPPTPPTPGHRRAPGRHPNSVPSEEVPPGAPEHGLAGKDTAGYVGLAFVAVGVLLGVFRVLRLLKRR